MKSSFIQEEDSTFMKRAPTLVRRVSDMFKDGSYSGPPSLFSQKIRHCCQNLNLFPYMLYSFEKSHPIAKKVNLCFDLILKNFIQRFLIVYGSIRHAAISELKQKSLRSPPKEVTQEVKPVAVSSVKDKLCKSQKQKTKQGSVLLIIAIYLAPLILAFQLIGLCSLLIFGKYTPGFIFLVTSLLFLGYISVKIMFHDTCSIQRKKEERIERKKQE